MDIHSSAPNRIALPVIALTLYAIAAGYLMSLVPLMLPHYQLESDLASWLASVLCCIISGRADCRTFRQSFRPP